MTNIQLESYPALAWHLLFLSRIYSFIGWLGMLGAGFLLLAGFAPQSETQQVAPVLGFLPWYTAALLLAAWSVVLCSFAKDVACSRRWSSGLPGAIVALFSLLSVPIGTAIGTYTLWVQFQYRRKRLQCAG